MAKRMQKDALIVLCILAVLVIVWAIGVCRTSRHLNDVVRITDARTEHLRDRLQSVENRAQSLEKRIGDIERWRNR